MVLYLLIYFTGGVFMMDKRSLGPYGIIEKNDIIFCRFFLVFFSFLSFFILYDSSSRLEEGEGGNVLISIIPIKYYR